MSPTEKTTLVAVKALAMQSFNLKLCAIISILLTIGKPLSSQSYPNPNDLHTGSDLLGGDLPEGALDLVWDVAHGPDNYTGPTLPSNLTYVDATVTGNCAVGAWVDPYPNGKWISFDFNENPPCEHNDVGDVDLFFKTEFALPSLGPCNTPIDGGWCLVLDYLADNQLFQIFVNGVPQLPSQSPNYNFEGFKYPNRETQELCTDWIDGDNEVVIHIKSGPNAEGFLAQARIPIIPNATDPVCIVKDVTLNLESIMDEDTISFAQIDNGSYSPCNTFATSLSQEIFTIDDEGDNTVTLFLMNSGGATTSCEFNVQVIGPDCSCDSTPPTFDSLPDTIMDIACSDPLPPFQYLTVTDEVDAPIILECVDVSVSLANDFISPNDCEYTVDTEDFDISVLQSCNGIMSLTHELGSQNDTTLLGNSFPIGTNPVIWTAIDSSGNILIDTCYFTVVDNTAPNVFCTDNLIVTEGEDGNNDDLYFVSGNILDATATDQCQNLTSLTNDINNSETLDGQAFGIGTHIITWTAIDSDGNTSICEMELQVFEEGTIISQEANEQSRAPQNNKTTVSVNTQKTAIAKRTNTINKSSSNQSGVDIVTSVDPFTVNMCDGYEITYRWTATDSCGNSSSVTESFNVLPDTEGPEMMCQDIVIELNQTGMATLTPEMFDVGSSDGCNWMDLSIDITEVSCNDVGQDIIVTLTGLDECGNSNTCTAIVEVQDIIPAQIICAPAVVFSDSDDGNADCQHLNTGIGLDPIAVDDNCGDILTLTHDYSGAPSNTTLDGALFPLGITSVAWTVFDMSGGVSTCLVDVTVIDSEAPTCIDQGVIDIVISAGETIIITSSLLNTPFNDNCSFSTITFNPSILSCNDAGLVNVIASVVDQSGNMSECPVTFNVIAEEDIECLLIQETFYLDQDGIVELDAEDIVSIVGGGCGNTYIPSISQSFFSCNDAATSPITIDIFVNGVLCGVDEVIILDTVTPTITCPVDLTVDCGSIPNTIASINEFIFAGGEVIDNCPILSISSNRIAHSIIGGPSCAIFEDHYTLTDQSGNTSICTHSIFIEDFVPPTIECSPIFLNVTSDSCIGEFNGLAGLPVVFDNCSELSSILLTHNYISAPSNNTLDGAEFPKDTTIVTWTAIDACGNVDSCQQTIIVIDPTSPECTANDVTINLDANGMYTTTDQEILSYCTYSDNCTIASLEILLPKYDFDCADVGSDFEYILNLMDETGNSSTCIGIITVQEGPNSALCVPNDITISLDDNGVAQIVPSDIASSSSSSCGTITSSISQNVFDCNDLGENVILITTANDFASDTCTATVTVIDEIAPTCNVQGVTLSLDSDTLICLTPEDFIPPSCIPEISCINASVGLEPVDEDGDSVPDNEIAFVDISYFVDDITNPCNANLTLSFSPDTILELLMFDCSDLGTSIIEIFIFDDFGNSSSCTTYLEIQDNNNVDACNANSCFGMTILDINPQTGFAEILASSIADGDPTQDTIYAFSQDENDTLGVFDCSELGLKAVDIWIIINGIPSLLCEVIVEITDTQNTCTGSLNLGVNSMSKVANTPVFYDNCEIDTIIFDPSKLDCSNFGINTINITVIDVSGNQTQCSSVVTLRDSIAPVCVDLDTTIYLGPLECEVVVDYVIPDGVDPCGGTIFTTPDPMGLQPGDIFPIGTTVIEYVTSDEIGNSTTCQYEVNIIEYQTTVMSCKDINLSLDENCEAVILPSMILTGGNYGCLDSCEVTITDLDDNPIPNMLNGSHAGQILKVKVCCGGNCCWSYVTIEDKLPPVIECKDTLVTCLVLDDFDAADITSFPGVSIVSECSEAELVLVNEMIDNVSCDDTEIIAYISRSWKAISEYGLESEVCTQNIAVQKINLDDIQFPSFVYLDCAESGLTDLPPSQDILGVPTIGQDTILLFPTPYTACNINVRYEDQILLDSGCKKKIMRMWTIDQWHCSTEDTRKHVQMIEITDQEAPTVTVVDSIEMSTSPHQCEARFLMPSPEIQDNCSHQFDITINTDLGNYDITEYIEIPIGTSEIVYQVSDECGNIAQASTHVTVFDQVTPIAICDQIKVVSISLDTVSELPAIAIDGGSYDECSDVNLQIARMDDQENGDTLIFRDHARYYCSDAGEYVMTVLQVTDASGNMNICMMEVEVQDKVEGRLICPEDVTIDCDTGINQNDLSAQFGTPTVLDNCPGNLKTRDYLQGQLGACGSGQLSRVILLEDMDGTILDSCIQNISVTPANPFSEANIEWPEIEFVFDGCKDVEVPTEVSGLPVISSNFCQLAGMRYEDQVFDFSIDGACQKILRKWFVVDWCQTESDGSLVEYTFDQVIKINNLVDPTIDILPQDTTFCSFEAGCDSLLISDYLQATATDDCTISSELLQKYEVYVQPYNELLTEGLGLDANGKYAVGKYSVRFIVEDRCGNQVTEEIFFGVDNCNTPIPYCLAGLAGSLAAWDTDSDGEIDAEMLMLTPDFFDAGSYHPCGYDVQLSFSADTDDTIKLYSCEDIGMQEVQIWVTDQFGNQDFCVAELDVQDNNDIAFCNDGLISELGTVQGRLYTEMDMPLHDTEVYMTAQYEIMRNSDIDGQYAFPSVPMGADLIITPYNDENHLNGVSTLDLVMIQRHILGLQGIESPYKLIAADINNDEKLTASDLLALRKVILGVDLGFQDNTSWRFIDETHDFFNDADPWSSGFSESYEVQNFASDMNIDFVAVKTGDVTDNASLTTHDDESNKRQHSSYSFIANNYYVEASESFSIAIRSAQDAIVHGFQLEFATKNMGDTYITSGSISIDEQSYLTTDEVTRVSYDISNGIDVKANSILFTISGISKKSGMVSEIIQASKYGMIPEIYLGDDINTADLVLDWSTDRSSNEESYLKQNYPNPWLENTEITYIFDKDASCVLNIYALDGQIVYNKILDGKQGVNKTSINNTDLPNAGVYIYELIYNERTERKKMIMIE